MGSCALCARCKATVRVSFSWMAHCTKVISSIPEGDQKGHKYTCFARSDLCTGNLYDLYALEVKSLQSLLRWVIVQLNAFARNFLYNCNKLTPKAVIKRI